MRAASACRLAVVVALLATATAAGSVACNGDAVSANTGLSEPLQVAAAQFLPGELPGVAAVAAGVDAGPPVTPDVADISVANTAISQGEQGLIFSGHASTDAQSIAMRFADMGTGYWIAPVGSPDPTDNGLLTWELDADFGRGLTPGNHTLEFASIDAAGQSGTRAALTVCLDTPVPDNLNICAPKRTPPAAVLSLSWNAAVDLDLSVRDPSGVTIGGKVSVGSGEGGATVVTDGASLDHDSNASCAIDGIDREDIVWQAPPQGGVYQVWVDLFSSCGLPAATFTVSLWLAEGQPDGTQRLVEQPAPIANGELLAIQANAGSAKGLFVGQYAIQ